MFSAIFFTEQKVSIILRSRVKREKEIASKSKIYSPDQMLERYRWVEQQVEKIQGRGGRVVFIRMPSSGEVRRIEFLTWPREKYWDQFAASIAAPAIHFEDYPSLSGFNCPDGSHLDENSARQFTRNLLKIL